MKAVEPCNNTSAGILVWRNHQLLLIERRKPPYGWAPPAGHVDDGETYLQAAHRELFEEVGLEARFMRRLFAGRCQNRCRRPGGDFHHWQVFEASCDGEPVRSEDETRSIRWVTRDELDELSELSLVHITANADADTWRHRPGLEPVWMDILSAVAQQANQVRELSSMGIIFSGKGDINVVGIVGSNRSDDDDQEDRQDRGQPRADHTNTGIKHYGTGSVYVNGKRIG